MTYNHGLNTPSMMSKAERGQLYTTAVSNVWMQMATVRQNHTA